MKKLISISCVILMGLGCRLAWLSPYDYENAPMDKLEAKAATGDVQASFWLVDRYFLGQMEAQDIDIAKHWERIVTAIEKDLFFVFQPWFQKAYQSHHPIAVTLMLFDFGNKTTLHWDLIDQLGEMVDNFLLAQQEYPQYKSFFAKVEEPMKIIGKICYTLSQKYYDEKQADEVVNLWADRACKLNFVHGCFLSLKTF